MRLHEGNTAEAARGKKNPKPAKPTACKTTKEYDDLLSDLQEEACQVWKGFGKTS